MTEDVVQTDSLMTLILQTLFDKILGLRTQLDVVMPVDLTSADLSVIGVGDVSTEHVIEEDTETPGGETVSSVFSLLDPLWWRVDSGASELIENLVLFCLVVEEAA